MPMQLCCKFTLENHADSVEWCPIPNFFDLFVVGNYNLKGTRKSGDGVNIYVRTGRVLLYKYDVERKEATLKQELITAAVLDQRWAQHLINGKILLAAVNTENTLEIYELDTSVIELRLLKKFVVPTPIDRPQQAGLILLSVEWSTNKFPAAEPRLCVGDDAGRVHVFQLAEDAIRLLHSSSIHKYEVWASTFDCWHPELLYSGADDNIFMKSYYCLLGRPTVRSTVHQAGVTCIQTSVFEEYLVATGSYDGMVRLFDTRAIRQPLAELKMGSCVWRLKWDPRGDRDLIVACMEGGVKFVNANNTNVPRITDVFDEHKSMAYGVDWCHLMDERIFASCSFYDALVCIGSD